MKQHTFFKTMIRELLLTKGFNRQAGYIFCISILALIIGWELLSHTLGNTPTAQSINFLIFGVVIVVSDIFFRCRDSEPFTWLSVFNPYRGGALGGMPCWLFGIGFVVAAIASLVESR